MAWDPYNDPVNYIVLAGRRSSGLADVAGAGTPRNWEERKGYGFSGATLWFTGLGLANFTVRLRHYTSEDIAKWHEWKDVVQRPPYGTLPKALDIWHPLLEECGINSVVVTDARQLEQVDDGVWEALIEFRQYRRLKLALAKPEGSTDKPPADPWERKLQELTEERNAAASANTDRIAQHSNIQRLWQGDPAP